MRRFKPKTSARLGAALMDKVCPGWFRKTKITKLDMKVGVLRYNGCGCILAQTYGDFGTGLAKIEEKTGREVNSERLGFTTYGLTLWSELDEAWKDEIRARRKAAG
jgi:hypothetical protein